MIGELVFAIYSTKQFRRFAGKMWKFPDPDSGDYGPEVLLRELQVWTAKVYSDQTVEVTVKMVAKSKGIPIQNARNIQV